MHRFRSSMAGIAMSADEYAIDAERCVLAACVDPHARPDAVFHAVLALTPEDFTGSRQDAFRAICDVVSQGGMPSPVAVYDCASSAGLPVDKIATELSLAFEQVYVSDVNQKHYCAIVAEAGAVRTLALAGRRGASIRDSSEQARVFAEALSRLAQRQSGGVTLGEAVKSEYERIERVRDGKEKDQGLRFGLGVTDASGGVYPGELWTVGGMPGQGKTALGLQVAHASATQGHKTIVFSLEMSTDELVRRMLAQGASGLRTDKLRLARLSGDDWMNLHRKATDLYDLPLKIYDAPSVSVEEMHAVVQREAFDASVRLVLVDYLQIMQRTSGQSKAEQLEHITRQLKAMAKDVGCTVILFSQLNKDALRRDGAPELFDLAGSSGPGNDSDGVIILKEGREEGTVDAWLIKNRHGAQAVMPMGFDKARYLFFDREKTYEVPPKKSSAKKETKAEDVDMANAKLANAIAAHDLRMLMTGQ